MKTLILISILLLSGCAGVTLENSIGIDPDDNAALCVSGDIDPAFTESKIRYRRIELPAGYEVTPEQLAALISACSE